MLNFLKFFFMSVRHIELFLSEKIYKEMTGLNLLMTVAVIVAISIYSLTEAIPDIFVSIFIIIMAIIVFLGTIQTKILNQYSLRDLFKHFSFKSYILCLIFMSFVIYIATMGLAFAIFVVTGEIIAPQSIDGITVTFLIIVCIESVLWFSFHIISDKVPLQDIKVKIAQYSAVFATLLLAGELIHGEGFLKLPIGFIVLSYLWITYIVELKVREQENMKLNRHHSA